jgi:glycosyltransferase involved in cell wall biosynthesis
MNSTSVTKPETTGDLVSIIVACHNHGRFVGEAIESALTQIGVTVEVIVVDDGSTDDTCQVVARHAPARYVKQSQSGPSVARNRGLQESEGDFDVFLDADDRLVPGALESSLAALRSHPDCAFAFGRHRYVDADGRAISTPPPPPDVNGSACFNDRIVLDYRIHGANMISRPAYMLEQALAAHGRKRDYVRAHPQYRVDYRFGLELAREYFGSRIAREAWLKLRGGKVR